VTDVQCDWSFGEEQTIKYANHSVAQLTISPTAASWTDDQTVPSVDVVNCHTDMWVNASYCSAPAAAAVN